MQLSPRARRILFHEYPASAYIPEKPLVRMRMLAYDLRWLLTGLAVVCAIYAARHWFDLF
ncbi:hypothetical protein A3C20_00780 [Candidatus Kaiserbacteria bacterium RIFCSPHIGHO2_02_FULL_55_25]|uniref:Uncharacterized protein n=1 Tax=Candidatus Kaiserbacteria bacterium RIFCSPHIGHO2_02_FULL_55_25 TaxID=1798498 RepID=A0A1F6E702_9BACT|nr:MAG: hypothetical protein A2764_00050 [Candidatus Kaiserbacteria bacterium RIFCSPHIGHO2_01_FULL_55_79]OGG69485.1 MAG: hypothetical protein A3C20_00780 [Candidatus Kaiserbacteria bacterium RIFCSPHIGHO2_02_FULL_55_25]OGG77543.1 MAG: hypothetical protein A3F56_01900 [Candidatus Kaiserbacteria bacterium RIFCSPHIGHO2_12_FULL_55_13]OGG83178.1 MAG: hypothetical protein A3A42_01260 [Candidatus Kaiserbacteria bacterium RIFCSPLOWO2_01_FULL_55_25]